jgi:hypothetical protein
MSAVAHEPRVRAAKPPRPWPLVVLELLIAVNAVGGGVYGLAGAKDVPREWLDGSPFHSFVIPSLVLLVAVGGSMVAAVSSLLAGYRRAAELSIAAGLILLGWITVETLVIPFSWLQPSFFALGLAVVALGRQLLHSSSASTTAAGRGKERK